MAIEDIKRGVFHHSLSPPLFEGLVETLSLFYLLAQISSTNEKITWLKNHDDEDFKEILKWYLDTSRITGIAEKKYDKVFAAHPDFETQDCKTFSDVIRYLDCNHTGKDEYIAWVKHLGEQIYASPEEEKVFRALVCKNFLLFKMEDI